jgi:hypothetical protein
MTESAEPVEREYTVGDIVYYDGPMAQDMGVVTRVDEGIGIEVALVGGEKSAPHVAGGVMYTSWPYLRPVEDVLAQEAPGE